MSQIQVTDLSFAYPGSYDNIFEHVSLTLDTDWKLGFVGRNGRGKTTFLRLLMNQYPYRGKIAASVGFDYFPFPIADPNALARELLLSVSDAEEWRLLRELSLLQVAENVLDRPFSTLSMGERTKLLLAALFSRSARFLLIDEPTNHLDMHGRALVSRYLSGKRGFILVSHDRAFLDGCIDHVLSVNRADIELQRGNYSTWEENRRRLDAFEQAENERLEKEIASLRAAAARTAEWSDKAERTKIGAGVADKVANRGFIGAKSAKMMKRSKAIEGRFSAAAEEKEGLLKNLERSDALKLTPLAHHAARLIEAREVTICYDGRRVCGPLSLTVSRGERIALVGRNGCGKSSLLRLLAGEDAPSAGDVRRASGLTFSRVPQDASFLSGSLTAYGDGLGLDRTRFMTVLRKLDFPRVQFEKPMESYSLGQKKKVLLGASLCQSAHLYVWDEPLNYVDILSRSQLEALILDARQTMLLVEHDRAFVERVATRVIEL